MKPIHGFAALIGLAVALILIFFLTGTDDVREDLVAEAPPPSRRADEGETPMPSAGVESPRRSPAAPEPTPVMELPAPEPPQAPTPRSASWILWLDLQGPALEDPVTVKVQARPDGHPFVGPESVTATCPLNARTRIVLDDLLAGGRPLATLMIEATHPELQPHTENVAIPSVSAADLTPPAPVTASLVLHHGARVVGDTVDAKGNALASRIGIWRFEGDRLEGKSLRETDTDASGHFEVDLPGSGDFLLVAANHGAQPAWQRFASHPASPTHETGNLVLGPGVEFDGKFTVGGEVPPYPVSFSLRREVEGVILHWDWWFSGPSPGGLVWTGTRIERYSADQVADGQGSFHVAGLVPGEYEMQLHGFDQGHGRMSREPRSLSAPAHGVAIELAWSRMAVRLELEDPTAPPLAATLVLERPDHPPERSDCFGGELTGESEREFIFDAGEAVTFHLEVEGLDPLRRELFAPPAGTREEVRFAIPALDRSARLSLKLSGELPPDGTTFIVHVASLDRGPARADLGLVGDGNARKVQLVDRALLLDGLAPGRILVIAYPGEWVGQRASHLLDASTEVDLLSRREATAFLRFEKGGRLRIGQRDGHGGWAMARCEVRDGDGTTIETTFVSYAPDGGGGASARGMLPDLAPSDVVPNLPPGNYSVSIDGREREVEVRAGETTEVIFD